MPQLTKEQRNEIIILRQAKCGVTEIARRMGITKSTVYKWLERYEAEGSLERLHRVKFARSTTTAQDLAIIKAHSSDPLRPTSVTAREFSISALTVRRRLHKAGLLNSYKPERVSSTDIPKDCSSATSETKRPRKRSKSNVRSAETDSCGGSMTGNELEEHLRDDESSRASNHRLQSLAKDTETVSCDGLNKKDEINEPLLYDYDSGESSHQTSVAMDTDQSSDQLYKVYYCKGCSNFVSGFRYICVQCADVQLCSACEAAGLHEVHYVLRVPVRRPEEEIASVLEKIREELFKHKNVVESIKTETTEEPDPLGAMEEIYIVPSVSMNDLPVHAESQVIKCETTMGNTDSQFSSDVLNQRSGMSMENIPNFNHQNHTTAQPELVEPKIKQEKYENEKVFLPEAPSSSKLLKLLSTSNDHRTDQQAINGPKHWFVVSNFSETSGTRNVTMARPTGSIGTLVPATMTPQTLPHGTATDVQLKLEHHTGQICSESNQYKPRAKRRLAESGQRISSHRS